MIFYHKYSIFENVNRNVSRYYIIFVQINFLNKLLVMIKHYTFSSLVVINIISVVNVHRTFVKDISQHKTVVRKHLYNISSLNISVAIHILFILIQSSIVYKTSALKEKCAFFTNMEIYLHSMFFAKIKHF